MGSTPQSASQSEPGDASAGVAAATPAGVARTRWARRLALGALLLVAALLRLPLGLPLHPDEAATAADARDLPAGAALTYAHERGGWVEGTYVWLAAPALALPLPPAEAARLPARLAGVLLVLATYLLGRRLGREDEEDGEERGERVGLAAAAVVAVAPWGFHPAGLALRATLVPALVVGGLAAWEAARGAGFAGRRGRGLAALGSGLLTLAALTYPPARLVVPLLAGAWLLLARVPRRRAALLVAPVVGALLVLLPWTLRGAGGERLAAVSVLDASAGLGENVYQVARGYGLHFSSRHLWSGASSRGFAPEGFGLLPLWTAPLLLAGLLTLGARRDRAAGVVGAWLLLHPLAAAFTRDVPDALRANLGLPAWALLGALGLDALLRRAPAPARRPALALALGAALLWGGWTGLRYRAEYPRQEAAFYYPGRRQAVRAALAGEGPARFEGPFWEAYLRLYAPGAPRRREAGGWVLEPAEAE